jgi:hypothetical protein
VQHAAWVARSTGLHTVSNSSPTLGVTFLKTLCYLPE